MEIVKEHPLKSGYQARPVPPPSAGKALSVLVAVCAVLWIWLMLPQWWQPQGFTAEERQQVSQLLFHGNVLWPLVLLLNAILFLYGTRLMWPGARPTLALEAKRGFVLLLCVIFHVFSIPCAVLLSIAVALD